MTEAERQIRSILDERILVLDGAMGVMLQGYELSEADYRGNAFVGHQSVVQGCNDLLSVTRPDIVREVHRRFLEAGADMIFAEAVSNLEDFQKFKAALSVPILANLTEFGQTPAFTVDELRGVSVDIALYPLTAFRAANRAAEKTFNEIRTKGTQTGVVNDLQTRAELYEYLDYHKYESKLDELFESESND